MWYHHHRPTTRRSYRRWSGRFAWRYRTMAFSLSTSIARGWFASTAWRISTALAKTLKTFPTLHTLPKISRTTFTIVTCSMWTVWWETWQIAGDFKILNDLCRFLGSRNWNNSHAGPSVRSRLPTGATWNFVNTEQRGQTNVPLQHYLNIRSWITATIKSLA